MAFAGRAVLRHASALAGARPSRLRVAFIGAGSVNFGEASQGPWDHATRVERLAGEGMPLDIVGVVDPAVDKVRLCAAPATPLAPHRATIPPSAGASVHA